MARLSRFAVVVAAVFTGACFHTTVETGLPASTTVIQKDWAHSFIYGLVPPSTMETKAQCPNGVARVETQHSFLNGLVAAITWSIYTPVTITVTCASSNKMASLPVGASVIRRDATTASSDLILQAVDRAVKTGEPVFVELR